MIHGFVGGIYDYGSLPTELELIRKFDVFTFTLPGHEKLIVKDVNHTDWIKAAEEQIELLINNNYKTIYVIGHSMGGVLAAHLASKYKQVKKLVLAAPAFRYFYFKEGKVNIKGFNETIKNMPTMFKNMGTEKVLERIAKTPITTMLEFTKLVNTLEQDVKNITCPVLTIRGLDDKVVPSEGTDFVYLGKMFPTPAYDNEVVDFYYTKKGAYRGQHLDDDENINLSRMTLDEIIEGAVEGRIPDAKTMCMALLIQQMKLRK